MARDPRNLPIGAHGRGLVELTSRTIHGRYLLRPGGPLNQTVIGVLAKAQKETGAEIHAFSYLSNHSHLLCSFADAEQMAAFQGYVNGNLAREVNRLHDWPDKFWARRYKHIPVSDEEEVQIARLRYVLGQGVKECLVRSPLDWPGPTSTNALHSGHQTMTGIWVDRTGMFNERRRGGKVREADFTSQETLRLTPIPCWSSMTREDYREQVCELVQEIEDEGRADRELSGRAALGPARVLKVHPHSRPERLDRSPAPRFHVKAAEERRKLREALSVFLAAYREASERLREGKIDVKFPPGCFPPRLPFTHPKLVPD